MNSVNLVGRITKDPELRRTESGKAVCSYSLAVKRPRAKDTTDFIECVTWQQGAEYLSQYGHKGDVVAVSGVLASRKWTDKEGRERTQWEVVTDSVELLSSKKSENTAPQANNYGRPTQQPYQQQNFAQIDGPDEQLPF